MIKKFSSENGSGLVLVMMVLVVLSALGSTLGMVTINSRRLAEHTQDTNSAYYIAEAGANMAYEEFKLEVLNTYNTSDSKGAFESELENVLGNIDGREYKGDVFQITKGSQPSATIEMVSPIEIENGFVHTIRSTGKVDGKARTVEKDVKVTWIDKGSGDLNPSDSFPIDLSAAVSVRDNILAHSNKLEIIGDIISVIPNKITAYETIPKPLMYDLYNGGNEAWKLQSNIIYTHISPIINERLADLVANTKSTIDNESKSLKEGDDIKGDIITLNGSITSNGSVKIDGNVIASGQWNEIRFDGPVHIKGDVISSGRINFKQGGIVEGNIISLGNEIMLEGSKELTVKGSVITLGKGSNMKLSNHPTTIYGNVISNGGDMIFETKIGIHGATINPDGRLMSGKNGIGNESYYNGPILMDDFQVKGATKITHTENYKNHFPFNMNTGNTGATPGDSEATPGDISDIISSTPATEN